MIGSLGCGKGRGFFQANRIVLSKRYVCGQTIYETIVLSVERW